MEKSEILEIARIEKLDEGRKYINDFALGTVGVFAFIGIGLIILYKIVVNESYGEWLSLLTGLAGAFCYGKFVSNSKKHWLFGAVILFIGAGTIFMQMPGL